MRYSSIGSLDNAAARFGSFTPHKRLYETVFERVAIEHNVSLEFARPGLPIASRALVVHAAKSSGAAIRDYFIAAPLTEGSTTPWQTGATLDQLLALSVRLRRLYKHARWQTSSIQFRDLHCLFDSHYQEQRRLVDILVDRMSVLGHSGSLCTGDLLEDTQFSYALRGQQSRVGLVRDLLDTHDSVRQAARSADIKVACHSECDFAIRQMGLTNDLQCRSISDALPLRSPAPFYTQKPRLTIGQSLHPVLRGGDECK